MSFLRERLLGAALCLLFLLHGGAATPQEEVGKRALERWQALIQRDFEKAYGFLSPAYRSAVSLESYKSRISERIRWTEATLKGVSCEEARCEVTLEVGYRYVSKPFDYEGRKTVKERWIHSQGGWWYVPGN